MNLENSCQLRSIKEFLANDVMACTSFSRDTPSICEQLFELSEIGYLDIEEMKRLLFNGFTGSFLPQIILKSFKKEFLDRWNQLTVLWINAQVVMSRPRE